ncbi:hypothetical protein [Solimonas marina]|uniref:Uncharacterized protein n=1 Tax=Solimonas marina TaxID=2714601 RepID=A0A969WAQ7_9GAMM|nr:hypothetical protein [Solimonas marina]NKF23068.1 hypothetical protein [Solimonas marina]
MNGKNPDGWLDFYPEFVREATARLLSHEDTKGFWPLGIDDPGLRMIAGQLEVALYDSPWDKKTQRERQQWLTKFEKTLDTLLQLMDEAPYPPKDWGFPVRDIVLMEAASKMGVSIPRRDDVPEFFREMLRLEDAVSAVDWTLRDSLQHYREQQLSDARVRQALKKPRDAKASRALFILNIKSKRTAREVAAIASVAFNDDAIDERLVRRLASTRADSSKIK